MSCSMVAILDDNAEVVILYFLFTKFFTNKEKLKGVPEYNHGYDALPSSA